MQACTLCLMEPKCARFDEAGVATASVVICAGSTPIPAMKIATSRSPPPKHPSRWRPGRRPSSRRPGLTAADMKRTPGSLRTRGPLSSYAFLGLLRRTAGVSGGWGMPLRPGLMAYSMVGWPSYTSAPWFRRVI
jgi:hypothetical protein